MCQTILNSGILKICCLIVSCLIACGIVVYFSRPLASRAILSNKDLSLECSAWIQLYPSVHVCCMTGGNIALVKNNHSVFLSFHDIKELNCYKANCVRLSVKWTYACCSGNTTIIYQYYTPLLRWKIDFLRNGNASNETCPSYRTTS